ncbi:hypothetical protein KQ910_14220 [Reyranella sp. MMS21-HV4-11]|uniref:Uncharacterized protein n=1 Tax=Reyranella humidisoli TaxID=2849149 RepID=A0ABS6IK05_9HYPH|nr:hypothetical protein [Reyranella sp. MMS21-HV4-11]MBU8874929.1 hypothetical protein [Reyranella sp. MMS21-HV4-11]
MFTKRFLMTAAIAGTLATTAGAAFAQGQPIVGISTVTTYSIDATITAIDPAKRTVTFTGPAGRSLTSSVSPGVKMDTSKVGDLVSAAFENKLTFVLSGPNAKTPRDRDLSVTAAASSGNRAAGAKAEQTVANWWVTGVNPSAGTISVVNPSGGEVQTYTAATAEGRAQLPRVKTGDNLTAIDTSVLIVAITPKK